MKTHRNLTRFLATGYITISLVACASSPSGQCPTIIHYPKPQLDVDNQFFLGDGCLPASKGSAAPCAADSRVALAGCPAVRFVDPLLGGLDPHEPIALCVQFPEQYGSSEHIVYRDGAYHVLKTPDEFRVWYAPIESEDEALSYALAMTEFQARYDWSFCASFYVDYVFQTKQVEDTHVEPLEDGYRVYLFYSTPMEGIGPVVVDVARDGRVTYNLGQPIAKPI